MMVVMSLTRAEAADRAATVDVHEYEVHLDVTAEGDTFGSRTVGGVRARPGSSTFLEFEPVAISSMTLNGAEVPASAVSAGRLALAGLASRNELVVSATMRYSNTGEGLHRYVDPADGNVYLYQHLFINNAGRVLPAFDQPDLKASFRLSVTAPAGWPGAPSGGRGPRREGRWEFAATKPISTYLVS